MSVHGNCRFARCKTSLDRSPRAARARVGVQGRADQAVQTSSVASTRKRIRILIADDFALFREALGEFLGDQPHCTVVGAAVDGRETLSMVARLQPDLVLMDVHMPQLNGLEAMLEIRSGSPAVRVILISFHASEYWRTASIAAGADGFILKDHLHEQLLRMIAKLFPVLVSGAANPVHDRREGP